MTIGVTGHHNYPDVRQAERAAVRTPRKKGRYPRVSIRGIDLLSAL